MAICSLVLFLYGLPNAGSGAISFSFVLTGMNMISAKIVSPLLSLLGLFGPIFDKELRVSSRRRRNYVLRSGFCLALILFILSMWFSTIGIRNSGSLLYQISRYSQISRAVIISFVWYQFITAQLIAMIMLSSSISDEIRTGTLNVLMTTPINSFQIVTGKLLSKLLQLILLLAISLPVLTIIRVFGGIQWDYIVSCVFITMTAAIFVGALSLLLSTIYRHAFSVIIIIIVGYVSFFGVLSGFFILLAAGIFNQQATQSIIALFNPFWAMTTITQEAYTASMITFNWQLHCLIVLVAAAFVLAATAWKIRKGSLTEAFGKQTKSRSKKATKINDGTEIINSHVSSVPFKHIKGAPIVWKEMYRGFWGTSKTDRAVTVLLIIIFCLTAVSFLLSASNIRIFPSYLMSGMYLIIMVRLAVATAGSIAAEKESRTLPVLLVTPLEDKEIIHGKIIAALWRNGPLLILYFLLFYIFYYGIYHLRFLQLLISLPIAVIGSLGSLVFIVGSGCYFGVRFKTATAAIAATLGSYFALRFLFCGAFNPIRFLLYGRILRNQISVIILSIISSVVPILALGTLGIFLEQRAVRRLRQNIF
jgi:ABC-2 type transport system permease protein